MYCKSKTTSKQVEYVKKRTGPSADTKKPNTKKPKTRSK